MMGLPKFLDPGAPTRPVDNSKNIVFMSVPILPPVYREKPVRVVKVKPRTPGAATMPDEFKESSIPNDQFAYLLGAEG